MEDSGDAAGCASLRNVFASGEALPANAARRLRELTGARLHNLYGPTEAAVDVTFHEVTDADTVTVPIGAPVFNTRVYVLDSRLRGIAACRRARGTSRCRLVPAFGDGGAGHRSLPLPGTNDCRP